MAIQGEARRGDGEVPEGPRPLVAVLVGEVSLVDGDGRSWRVGGQQPQLVLAYLLLEQRTVSRAHRLRNLLPSTSGEAPSSAHGK